MCCSRGPASPGPREARLTVLNQGGGLGVRSKDCLGSKAWCPIVLVRGAVSIEGCPIEGATLAAVEAYGRNKKKRRGQWAA